MLLILLFYLSLVRSKTYLLMENKETQCVGYIKDLNSLANWRDIAHHLLGGQERSVNFKYVQLNMTRAVYIENSSIINPTVLFKYDELYEVQHSFLEFMGLNEECELTENRLGKNKFKMSILSELQSYYLINEAKMFKYDFTNNTEEYNCLQFYISFCQNCRFHVEIHEHKLSIDVNTININNCVNRILMPSTYRYNIHETWRRVDICSKEPFNENSRLIINTIFKNKALFNFKFWTLTDMILYKSNSNVKTNSAVPKTPETSFSFEKILCAKLTRNVNDGNNKCFKDSFYISTINLNIQCGVQHIQFHNYSFIITIVSWIIGGVGLISFFGTLIFTVFYLKCRLGKIGERPSADEATGIELESHKVIDQQYAEIVDIVNDDEFSDSDDDDHEYCVLCPKVALCK
ncbi:uncharacterized protein LOC126265303 [Aethina tumida]|uniref:uncharacterized protein LOC126265303 n=1 Tax=Aethina tumida TaxID=116153 RepID=UPI0021492A55|nr:uncharacterized protein LOC126265303 [Aethina tumida]